MTNTLWSLFILYCNITNFQKISVDITQLKTNPSLEVTTIYNLNGTYKAICKEKQTLEKTTLRKELKSLKSKCLSLKEGLEDSLSQVEKMNSYLYKTLFEALYYKYHEECWAHNDMHYRPTDEYLFTKSNQLFTIVNGCSFGLITLHKYFHLFTLQKEITLLDNLISSISIELNQLN